MLQSQQQRHRLLLAFAASNFQQLFLPVGVGRSRESSIAQTILAYEHAYSLVIVL